MMLRDLFPCVPYCYSGKHCFSIHYDQPVSLTEGAITLTEPVTVLDAIRLFIDWGGLMIRSLTGNSCGPDDESVPGITSADLTTWSVEDLELFLEEDITLLGDLTCGRMTDVIAYSASQLISEDRTSIAQYLLSESNRP